MLKALGMKFKKGMLEVGRTYKSPDGPLPVTVERLRHWRDTFRKFKALDLKVPVFFGHQDDPKKAVPVKRLPKNCAGKLIDLELSADGRKAEFVIDIPRAEDASKVENNLVELSPVVFEKWTDGDGTVHKDCITDVDLVVHPVDHRQEEFKPAIACSIRMGLDTGKPVIYRLAEHEDDEMADDDNTGHDSDGDSEGDGSDRVKRVIEGLAALNIIVPDDTDKENFFDRVEAAILTAKAMGDGGVDNEELEVSSPEFAALSLDSPLGKFQSKQHQTSVMAGLDALLTQGQCTPAEYKHRKPQVGSIRLSLDANGEHRPTDVEMFIAHRETVPPGSFWDDAKRTRMSNLEVVPHPEGLAGDEVTEEQAEKIVDGMFGT